VFSDIGSGRLENSGRSVDWRQEAEFLVDDTLEVAVSFERASEDERKQGFARAKRAGGNIKSGEPWVSQGTRRERGPGGEKPEEGSGSGAVNNSTGRTRLHVE